MNTEGVITGNYLDAGTVIHAFVRDTWGKITAFEDPYAGKNAGQSTGGDSINHFGVIDRDVIRQ